jgi:hypothetical protein
MRYDVGFCSSPGELNLISILPPVALNFGNDFEVSSRILKGSCNVVSNTRMFLLVEAIADSDRPLFREVTRAVGIALSLCKNNFFAIFQAV